MSREYVKTGADEYTPIGDTQGFYAPSELRFCGAARTDAGGGGAGWTASGWARYPLLWDTDGRFGGENWVNADNQIVAPETGLYLVTASGRYGSANTAMIRHAAARINGGMYSALHNAIHTETVNWDAFVIAGQARLNAGDAIDLAFQAEGGEGAALSVWDGFLRAALLQKSAPYTIANKGALVSGGAFRFDADGNGYTENYSFNEARVGTYADGKPLYKKTIAGNTPNDASGYSTGLPGSMDAVVKYEIVVKQASSYILTGGYNGSAGGSPDYEAAVDAVNARLSWVIPAAALRNVPFILHIYYTKTTD
jgi:hypothetical protein